MTTPANYKPVIINATQAAMLELLRNAVEPMTTVELFGKMGISRGFGLKHMACLKEYDLVNNVREGTSHIPGLWEITMAGRRALCDYRRKLEWAANRALAAPAPTRDTRGTQYHPPSNVYYRNTGHGHIASHGVRC